ncbi:hypothetical protein M3D92_00445 [Micrococcus terreus]|uniref:hypothetical protein n=1 Tax=Micrococcus terreus TaxID=574650 RepID=UPI0021A81370|nr:hypothetical protein [Micrococcus terreus]MCT2087765.1 hypothetical protein [Micrococcus terreus]
MTTIKYDAGAAEQYEADVAAIAGRIEGILGDREAQKNYVASNYQATDNDAEYDTVEKKWLEAGDAVKRIVEKARNLMIENDVTASNAHKRASDAIMGMNRG